MKLSVKELRFSYGPREVLRGIDLSLNEGELMTVLGPNGTGKTTFFKCVLGFLPGYTGSVLIGGEEAKTLSAAELARRIAYIPQNHRPSFGYSVLDMVLMGTAHSLPLIRLPGQKQRKDAFEALERLGVADLAEKNFARISGGEQQLVLMARALAQKAKLLVLDEPTASLDYGNQIKVMELIRGLAKEGYSLLVSTHDPQHALRYSDKAAAFLHGRVYGFGTPEEVITPETLLALYGMEAELIGTGAGKVIVPKR